LARAHQLVSGDGGRTIDLDGRRHQIVGIMPAEFELTIGRVQVAVPLPLTSTDLPRDVRSLEVWARLKPGVSSGQADAEMAIVAGDLEREYPDANGGYGARVLTLRAFMALGPISVMYLLQGALSFVLLIACANVANILLARGHDRRHDLAIRAALGASRHRTVRLLLTTESLLLAVGAGLAGCLLAVWGVRLLGVVVAGQLPRSMTPEMDGLVLGFGVGVSVFAGLLCGLAPALQASRPNVTAELRQGAHGAGSPRRLLARGLVVAMEGREFTHADRRIAEWEGVWLAALEFALGVPGVWLVSRLVQNALFGVSPRTSGTVVLAGLALFLVAVVASYVPARRAASVEPMLALRSE